MESSKMERGRLIAILKRTFEGTEEAEEEREKKERKREGEKNDFS